MSVTDTEYSVGSSEESFAELSDVLDMSVNSWYKVLKQNLEWSVAGLACRQFHKDAHLLVNGDQ